jgi:putrescine aminotransferase
VAALELVADKATRARFDDKSTAGTLCRNLSVESGLVMRAVGDTMIVAPPLTLTHEQIDQLIERAVAALDKTQAALGR